MNMFYLGDFRNSDNLRYACGLNELNESFLGEIYVLVLVLR